MDEWNELTGTVLILGMEILEMDPSKIPVRNLCYISCYISMYIFVFLFNNVNFIVVWLIC